LAALIVLFILTSTSVFIYLYVSSSIDKRNNNYVFHMCGTDDGAFWGEVYRFSRDTEKFDRLITYHVTREQLDGYENIYYIGSSHEYIYYADYNLGIKNIYRKNINTGTSKLYMESTNKIGNPYDAYMNPDGSKILLYTQDSFKVYDIEAKKVVYTISFQEAGYTEEEHIWPYSPRLYWGSDTAFCVDVFEDDNYIKLSIDYTSEKIVKSDSIIGIEIDDQYLDDKLIELGIENITKFVVN